MSDKMESKINSSMNEEFLDDMDKKKKPEPPKRDYGYGGYGSYGGSDGYYKRSQSSFDWDNGDDVSSVLGDDGPDPLDRDYSTRGSVFGGGRSKTSNMVSGVAGDYPRQIASVMRTVQVKGRNAVLDKAEVGEVVDLLMKAFAQTMDKAGLVWSTEGSKYLREALKDFIPMCYTAGSYKIVLEDDEGDDSEVEEYDVDFDPETGEVS